MRDDAEDLIAKFRKAVSDLSQSRAWDDLVDAHWETATHAWLDTGGDALPWACADRITPDEWFFITTLYGQMPSEGQRTQIRNFFPKLFVEAARRDVRNFVPNMGAYAGLRSPWMSRRLCRMGSILRERHLTMSEYAQELQKVDREATDDNQTPALDQIIRDHSATRWKTLSVFVRDCVRGNCFPIDSRVEEELKRHDLPVDERRLVAFALRIGRNPRELARLFYEAGGQGH